jgi:hypothetical protein
MKAATALKLHKFADATAFYAHCQFILDKAHIAIPAGAAFVEATLPLGELDKALLDTELALINLTVAKEALFQALNVEDLTP